MGLRPVLRWIALLIIPLLAALLPWACLNVANQQGQPVAAPARPAPPALATRQRASRQVTVAFYRDYPLPTELVAQSGDRLARPGELADVLVVHYQDVPAAKATAQNYLQAARPVIIWSAANEHLMAADRMRIHRTLTPDGFDTEWGGEHPISETGYTLEWDDRSQAVTSMANQFSDDPVRRGLDVVRHAVQVAHRYTTRDIAAAPLFQLDDDDAPYRGPLHLLDARTQEGDALVISADQVPVGAMAISSYLGHGKPVGVYRLDGEALTQDQALTAVDAAGLNHNRCSEYRCQGTCLILSPRGSSGEIRINSDVSYRRGEPGGPKCASHLTWYLSQFEVGA